MKFLYTLIIISISVYCTAQVSQVVSNEARLTIDSIENNTIEINSSVNEVLNSKHLIMYYGAVGTFDKITIESEGVTGIKLDLIGVGDKTPLGRVRPLSNFPIKSDLTIKNGIMHFLISGSPKTTGVAKFDLNVGNKRISFVVNVADQKLTQTNNSSSSVSVQNPTIQNSSNSSTQNNSNSATQNNKLKIDSVESKLYQLTYVVNNVISTRLSFPYYGAVGTFEKVTLESSGVKGLTLNLSGVSDGNSITAITLSRFPVDVKNPFTNITNGIMHFMLNGNPKEMGIARFDLIIGGKNIHVDVNVVDSKLTLDSLIVFNKKIEYQVGPLEKGIAVNFSAGRDLQDFYFKKNVAIEYFGALTGQKMDSLRLYSKGVEGLMLSMPAGLVNSPSGFLNLSLTGTPKTSGEALFEINLGGKNCKLKIPVTSKDEILAEILKFSPYYCGDQEFYNCLRDEALIKGKTVKTQIKMSFTRNNNGNLVKEQKINSYGVKGLVATFSGGVCDEKTNSVVFEVQGIPQSGGTAIFDLKLNNMSCKVKLKVLDPIYTWQATKIGNSSWMMENLAVRYFRNGDPIPLAQTNEEWKKAAIEKRPAMCLYMNDSTKAFSKFTDGRYDVTYGVLYNWYAVTDPRGLAPLGWSIPSVGISRKYADGSTTTIRSRFEDLTASSKIVDLKSKWGWKQNFNGTNTTLFSALPGGARLADGTFVGGDEQANWWFTVLDDDYYIHDNFVSSDAPKIENYGKVVSLNEAKGNFDVNKADAGCGYSVRCILDWSNLTFQQRDNYDVNVLSGPQLTGIKDLNQNKKEPEGELAPEFMEREFQGEEERH